MDRASGSGVFARDPDALLDLIELDVTDELMEQEENKVVCSVCEKWLDKYGKLYEVSQDDLCSQKAALEECEKLFDNDTYKLLLNDISDAKRVQKSRTAWRIEGTLREFPKFEPVNLWFDYPVHMIDDEGSLKDLSADMEYSGWKSNSKKKKSPAEKKKERKQSIEDAYEACKINGDVTVKDMAEYMEVTEKTVRNYVNSSENLYVKNGLVNKK